MTEMRRLRAIVLAVFAVGVLVGTTLIAITVWGDLEASLFNPGIQYDAHLRTLRCPVIITPNHPGTIHARIKNTLDRSTSMFLRARISEGYVTLFREEKLQLPLEPGEAQRVDWTINADDAAYDRLVLFKVGVTGGYPIPARQATCGVVRIGIPFLSGGLIYVIALVIGLAGSIGATVFWIRRNPGMLGTEVQLARAMVWLCGAIVVGIVVSFLGWWVLGILALVVVLMTIGVTIGYLASRAS